MLPRLQFLAARTTSPLPRLVSIGAFALSMALVVGLHVALVRQAALMLA
jgi:hypothetical protein